MATKTPAEAPYSFDCSAVVKHEDYRYADMPSGECGNRWIDKHWDLSQIGCFNRASSFELS
ncbi:hypothetical protein [Streptomyces aureocirculatus]|uniref:hypothetical protein n=1 Tax=Streptomyces aureocirculatus TaxID=67275 RepID=UPI0004C6F203|nr:hypothetical protein [Streptomyces aureocirculatus]